MFSRHGRPAGPPLTPDSRTPYLVVLSREGDWMPRALVIEGDPGVRERLADHLALRDGHIVETSASGKEGATRFCEGLHDVLIICAELPDGDGLQLAHQLRQIGPGTEVIITTSATGVLLDEIRGKARAFGALNLFTKPIFLAGLSRRIIALTS